MVRQAALGLMVVAALAAAKPAYAQTTPKDEGIPVDNALVRSKCGSCHRADDKGRMTRISYRRATMENWERTIRRMVTLNHVALEPADARSILKYLADRQGVAPEEVRPIEFEAERRTIEYAYKADETTANLCSSCHSVSRVMSERRTKEEWDLLIAMHRGYYPLVDNQPLNGPQGFRRTRPIETEPGPDGRPPDNRHPVDRALEHLTKTYPLQTSEWSAWSAAMQPPKLAGRWAVVGSQLGKGAIYGQVTVAADAGAPDSFTTEIRYTVARTGESVSRSGKALVYTGYQWRGRGNDWREVLFVERDWKEMWGRWFSGAYDETGIDVKLTRLSSDPVVFGTSATALKTGSTGSTGSSGSSAQNVKIYGANLPATVRPEDIGLGQRVKDARVISATPEDTPTHGDHHAAALV